MKFFFQCQGFISSGGLTF